MADAGFKENNPSFSQAAQKAGSFWCVASSVVLSRLPITDMDQPSAEFC